MLTASIAKTVVLTASVFLPYQPESIFPLLCPVREYEWIPDWKCELIQSRSGYVENGCVFRTNYEGCGGPLTWFTSVYEPSHKIEFICTSQALVSRFDIELVPVPDGTKMTWTQSYTALDEQGNALLRQRNDEAFRQMLECRRKQLYDYLTKHDPSSIRIPCPRSGN
jgi:hypothetical protein